MNKKHLVIAIGWIMVALGLIGIFLPVMPTVPFLLLAGYCFSKSSPRWHKWLQSNKYLRYYLENYSKRYGVPMHVKVKTLVFLWISLGIAVFFHDDLWYWMLLWAVGSGVTIHILMLKTKKRN